MLFRFEAQSIGGEHCKITRELQLRASQTLLARCLQHPSPEDKLCLSAWPWPERRGIDHTRACLLYCGILRGCQATVEEPITLFHHQPDSAALSGAGKQHCLGQQLSQQAKEVLSLTIHNQQPEWAAADTLNSGETGYIYARALEARSRNNLRMEWITACTSQA
jgi:hypothetical protein